MKKYQLRKIAPNQWVDNKAVYSSCEEYENFKELRHELNSQYRKDLWYGAGFHVINTDDDVIFDNAAVSFCQSQYGNQFTLNQVVNEYAQSASYDME